ncbi:SSPO protein, partial [Bucco capensis]|nr:SSPO protein [Bucco capensis]
CHELTRPSCFQPCHQVVDLEPFLELCLAEVCACQDGQQCLCPVLGAYARECAREGMELSWRNQSFCSLQCDGGLEYSPCGPPCPPTCRSLGQELPEHCQDLTCLEGCFCP